LSTLYITPIFHIFEKRTQNLLSLISVSTLLFIDDGLFISQEKNFKKNQMPISFVVIALLLISSNNLAL